jgi:hypothetical protein
MDTGYYLQNLTGRNHSEESFFKITFMLCKVYLCLALDPLILYNG